ncbi:MAG TPA: putative glycoside hydrolase, partial [Terriglobales bacterium]
SELAEAMRGANANLQGVFLKPNQELVIPGVLDAPITEKTVAVPKDFEVRAIYLTGLMAGSDHGIKIARRWREAGGNAVVFDIKDSDGTVNIPFQHPLMGAHKSPIRDLPKYTRFLHSLGLHAIARIAMFRDERLVVTHPELAIKSKKTGQPWRENGKLVWTDPSQVEVQEFDIALALAAAEAGADEIQFDYVRFPAEGDQKDASFSYQKAHPDWQRSDVIADFLRRAYASLHPKGVLLSLDVFGIMAWQRPVDLAHTGQDIVRMAKYCDVLSPMIYPSHFFGMDGIAKPGDAPEHFIGESMERFEKITAGSGAVIRPWLQAFAWRTKTYSPKYIEVQVLTAKNKGGVGFLFWNANNDYTKPYLAMPEMKAAKGQYFRGDEVGAVVKAEVTVPGTRP